SHGCAMVDSGGGLFDNRHSQFVKDGGAMAFYGGYGGAI
ncbi:hypothetical protein L195_g051612, partial [Trifolium pratense]